MTRTSDPGAQGAPETPPGAALADVVLGVAALAFALYFLSSLGGAPHSARFMSSWVCGGVLLSGAVILARASLRLARARPSLTALREILADREAIVLGLMVFYALLLGPFGFAVPSVLFIAACAVICGDRPLPAAILGLASAAVVLGLMVVSGFYIPLW